MQLADASSDVKGQIFSFVSPNGIKEQCIILDKMPGAEYSDEDAHVEQSFCGINLYDESIAVCPKTWSTSPGMEVFHLTGKTTSPAVFEQTICGTSLHKEIKASGLPITFKTTMNSRTTSGTFSTASLLYYHFSRYLHAAIHVPVAVYRSIDKDLHLQRVTRRGLELTAGSKARHMNHEAWLILQKAERLPDAYQPIDELFTRDRTQIYGVFIQPAGERYNSTLNGTRKSGWGEGQNRDFQNTAPFLALRSEQPLLAAIDHGMATARKDKTLRHDMGSDILTQQMVYWMQELTEITLLDYIFSQQDRIGNIDYRYYWYWIEQGQMQSRHAESRLPPGDIVEFKPVRLMRTQLNDNDAGGKRSYANFTKKTHMLEKIRHYNPGTYKRLLSLESDFRNRGELFNYVGTTFGLTAKQMEQIVKNTSQATAILKNSCEQGNLRFDLDPEAYFLTGQAEEKRIDCDLS
jgi:hypothetical protein